MLYKIIQPVAIISGLWLLFLFIGFSFSSLREINSIAWVLSIFGSFLLTVIWLGAELKKHQQRLEKQEKSKNQVELRAEENSSDGVYERK